MSLNVKGQRSRLLGTKSAVHSHHPRQRRNGTHSLQMTLRSGRRHHSVAVRGWFRRSCVRCMFGETSLALVWICFSSFCYMLTFISASCHVFSFSVQLPFSTARVCVQSKSNFCSYFCRATPCQRGIRYGLVSLVCLSPWTTNHPDKTLLRSRDPLKFFSPKSCFWKGEARHFKFDVRIDIDEYKRFRAQDRLPPKEMCSGSRDLFKFREITHNISETVQNRDTATTKNYNETSYAAYRMASTPMILSDIDGHFYCLKPSTLCPRKNGPPMHA